LTTATQLPRRNERLAPYTTFGIGGTAEWFFEPKNLDELSVAYRRAHEMSDDVRVLGGGSNLLVADGDIKAAIISMRRFEPRSIEHAEGSSTVRTSAGVPMHRLVKQCARWGLSGLEYMTGIPGTVGGAIYMNAGGTSGAIGSRIMAIDVMDTAGTIRHIRAKDIRWAYRSSNLRKSLVVYAELELVRKNAEDVRMTMNELFKRKSAAQPLRAHSAGCFFCNPDGDSAGRLVDSAGLKGFRVGGAEVSMKHANFLINRGNATASDVMELVRQVRDAVLRRFNVELKNEVHYWS
jgi:UDP-N-acetylmuramate dehydrogenase